MDTEDKQTVLLSPEMHKVIEIEVQRPSPQSPKTISVRVLEDGTINIGTPDGCITKIWPERKVS